MYILRNNARISLLKPSYIHMYASSSSSVDPADHGYLLSPKTTSCRVSNSSLFYRDFIDRINVFAIREKQRKREEKFISFALINTTIFKDLLIFD